MQVILLLLFCFVSPVLFTQQLYKEPYRPQFHFSPAANWTNDPNGLIYTEDEYHLFYQYNPFGNTWGHMSWGHAVSKDLIHWKHLPIAIAEEGNTMIFSGSAVIDKNNSAGFAKKADQQPLIAIYTAHINLDSIQKGKTLQNQHIAFSLDKGRTWEKYKGNPVLDVQRSDFRDPKVFWHEPSRKWIMTTVFPQEHIVKLYASPDLKQWTFLSNFGRAGDTSGIWECSDLLQVPVKEKPGSSKWVLLNSVATTMQYFIGEFDGHTFRSENENSEILRPDYGADFYAGITYNDLPAGMPPVLIGWVNNWSYAGAIPTSPWRGSMSVPRSLYVTRANGKWQLLQQPVETLKNYRQQHTGFKNIQFTGYKNLPVKSLQSEIELIITPGKGDSCGILLAVGNGKQFTIGYSEAQQQLYTDRANSGDTAFHPAFKKWLKSAVPVREENGRLKLHILLDKSIIEIFAGEGEAVITNQLFPADENTGITLFSQNGKTIFDNLQIWLLKSVW